MKDREKIIKKETERCKKWKWKYRWRGKESAPSTKEPYNKSTSDVQIHRFPLTLAREKKKTNIFFI